MEGIGADLRRTGNQDSIYTPPATSMCGRAVRWTIYLAYVYLYRLGYYSFFVSGIFGSLAVFILPSSSIFLLCGFVAQIMGLGPAPVSHPYVLDTVFECE